MTREQEIEKAVCNFSKKLDHKLDVGINYFNFEEMNNAFIDGIEWADNNQKNTWINYNDEKPEAGIEVIAFNHNWIDEDFNPNGTRVGFINGDGEFTSAYWWDYQDCYITINLTSCLEDKEFYSNHINNTEPEMWMPMPEMPKE